MTKQHQHTHTHTHTKQWFCPTHHPVCPSVDLRFYQQVKLVNYIRREIHQCRCYGCQEKFASRCEVLRHVVDAGHAMTLPEMSTWDQPQFVLLYLPLSYLEMSL